MVGVIVANSLGGSGGGLGDPDFDSGFVDISQGFPLTINHALGGDADKYLVVLDLNNNVAKTAAGIYLFNESAGDNVPDTSGNGNDLTRVGMVDGDWVPGKIGNALDFDGAGKHTIAANSTIYNFDNTDPFSFSAFINPNFSNSADIIFGKMGGFPAFQGYQWYVNPDGFVFMQLISDFQTGDHLSMTTKKAIPFGSFSQVGFTYSGNGKSSGCHLYIDGLITPIEITQEMEEGVGPIANSTPFQISGRDNFPTVTFNGIIDLSFVFARELVPLEMNWLFNNNLGREIYLAQSGNLLGPHILNKYNVLMGTHIETYNNVDVLVRRSILDPISDRVRVRIWVST